MNVFVLNSGRCGSSTFIKACQHIKNYSAAHESLSTQVLEKRLAYGNNHIEADNRLCWLLGRLDQQYGDNAIYVHLYRNPEDTINSFIKRRNYGIMKAYREGILMDADGADDKKIAEDYLLTIESNIDLFLKDKSHKMDFSMDNAKADFKKFWQLIGAEGDLQKALGEWDVAYNKS